jgi:MFS family permease
VALSTFKPLRHKSFSLSLLSSFVSSTGSWMQTVALGVYLTETTHDPLWLGLLTLAAWLPAVVGSPLGGVIADRWHRQRWIQINNVAMALLASLLATLQLTHHLAPATACYLAVIEGLCGSGSWAAWQSLLPDLVERDEVLAAVSLSSAQFNLGRIIGPIIAAVALAAGSPGWCFAINAATFVFVVIAFSFVRSTDRPRPEAPLHFWRETKEGARAAWATKGCRNPIIGVAIVAFIVSPFISLVPAMAIDVLHAGKTGTSWLVTAQGVGAVVAAVILPHVAKRSSRVAVVRWAAGVLGVFEVVYGLSPNLLVAAGLLVLLGGAYLGVLTGFNASVQLHAPLHVRSRILSLYTLSLSIFYPVGAVIQAALARTYGVRHISEVAGAVVAVVILSILAWRPSFFRSMGQAPTSAT